MNPLVNLLPDKANENIKILLSKLNIATEPMIVDIFPESDTEYGSCFVNVFNKVKRDRGEMIHGWQFCEYPYMIEAEFHAVWKAPNGKMLDITPSLDPNVKQILFAIDESRIFHGESINNARLNITLNELVDDIIRVEDARFRFMNSEDRKLILGELPLNEQEMRIWQIINIYSEVLEQMYSEDCTVHSRCFCESELSYSSCHRAELDQFLSTI